MLFCKSAKKYDFNQSHYPNPAFGHSDTVQVSFECSVTKEANGHKTVSNCSTCSTEFNNEDGNGWQWMAMDGNGWQWMAMAFHKVYKVQLWIGKTVLRNVLKGKFASSSSTSTVATYGISPNAPQGQRPRGPEAMTGQEVTHEAGARHNPP